MSEQESIGAAAPSERDIEALLQQAHDTYLHEARPKLLGAIALLDTEDAGEEVEAAAALLRSCLADLYAIGDGIDVAGTQYHAERKAGVLGLLGGVKPE